MRAMKPGRTMRTWGGRLAWAVGLVVLLEAIAWAAVPALLAWQLPKQLGAALGRPVTIGHVAFRPWALDLSADALVIGGAGGADPPLLRIRRLEADLSAATLWRLAPIVEALRIDGLEVAVARTAEGHYDVDDLLERIARQPPAPPDARPARFAISNLQVRDATLRFDDRPLQRVQRVEALNLSLPFISSLPTEALVKVEPRLAFRLNGTAFDSGAQATPFAATRNGELRLATRDLDLTPYLGYLPASLPARVTQGRLSAALTVAFRAPAKAPPSVEVKGALELQDVGATDRAGRPLLGWRRLDLALADVQPLARRLEFASIRAEGLQLHAARGPDGRINLAALGAAGAAPPSTVQPAVAGPAWQVGIGTLELADSRLLWTDAVVAPAVDLQLDHLSAQAQAVHWPTTAPVMLTLKGELHAGRPAASGVPPLLAEFSASGPLTERSARLALKVDRLALAAFGPYFAQALVPAVGGQLTAQGELDWSGAAGSPRLRLTLPSLVLDDLRLQDGVAGGDGAALVGLKQLALGELRVDVVARTVSLARATLQQPSIRLARDAAGRLNASGWIVGEAASAPPAVAAPASGAAGAWRVQLGELAVAGGQIAFADAAAPGRAAAPLQVALSNLGLRVRGFDWRAGQLLAPVEVTLGAVVRDGARVSASAAETPPAAAPRRFGRAASAASAASAPARVRGDTVGFQGRLALAPLVVNGEVRIDRFPVELFAPYVADRLPLSLVRARAGYVGSVAVRQVATAYDIQAAGDVLLADVHVATRPDQRSAADDRPELLNWQSLALKGLRYASRPGGRPQLDIGEAALTDFYSRLVVTEQGRFNLQDLGGAASPQSPTGPTTATTTPARSTRPAPPTAAIVVEAPAGGGPQVVAVASAPASGTAAPRAEVAASAVASRETPIPADIRIGAVRFENGRIDYTDHFVRPNYSAALTELAGRIGAFSTTSQDLAPIELRGKAAGTAALAIDGRLNPLARPLVLDLKAHATDLELAPLSPYSGKYVGYAIERGKLSVNLAYAITSDGRLQATNQIVLNQLTFGERVESKDATTLPVQLAIALLKDRNGVIDLDLPISGSLNDPQFSVGGLIWRLLGNLLAKAITSPFALLTGGFGGTDTDSGTVDFEPGTALPAPAGRAAIDKVAKALADRPALTMTLTGAADAALEHDAFQQAALDAQLVARERADRLRQGGTTGSAAPPAFAPAPASAASGVPSAAATSAAARLTGADRLRLLTAVYRSSDLPDRPRNLLGLLKEVPAAEMEARLKARIPVDADAMRELAVQRGLAVRDALIASGLPSERLFLAAPRLESAGAGKPSVRLTLSTR